MSGFFFCQTADAGIVFYIAIFITIIEHCKYSIVLMMFLKSRVYVMREIVSNNINITVAKFIGTSAIRVLGRFIYIPINK